MKSYTPIQVSGIEADQMDVETSDVNGDGESCAASSGTLDDKLSSSTGKADGQDDNNFDFDPAEDTTEEVVLEYLTESIVNKKETAPNNQATLKSGEDRCVAKVLDCSNECIAQAKASESNEEVNLKPAGDENDGVDQSDDILADAMLEIAQDTVEREISHLWPFFLSPYQAIELMFIK